MSLSVTGVPSALAALQTLALQSSNTSATKAAPASATPDESQPAVSVSATTGRPSLYALADSIGQAVTAADTADVAGQTVLGLLQKLRETAGRASDPAVTADQRADLNQSFQANAQQIGSALSSATVNGVNLIDGSQATSLKVALGDGATASLTPVDLSLGGSTLALPPSPSVATATVAGAAFTSLGSAIGAAGSALSTLRGQADQISAHAGFLQTLGQALGAPEGDDDDSIRLTALQLSQQLSAQPGAIANQSPQSILSLFRS